MNHDLIINTGIQFINIPLLIEEDTKRSVQVSFSERIIEESVDGDIYELVLPYFWEEEELYIDGASINPEAYTLYGELESSRIRRDYIAVIEEEDVYKVRGAEALEVCTGHWIPLPYFRIRSDVHHPFHHGPEDWCRAVIHESSNPDKTHTHILTLAFDTGIEENSDFSGYSRPRESDADDNGKESFKCVTNKQHAPKFFTNPSLNEWMFNLFWLPNRKRVNQNNRLRHLAIYHVFLDLIHQLDGFPTISLYSGQNSIEVCLALDIGNSRTCGLVCEKNRPLDSGPLDFTTSVRKMQLRNLSKPHQITDEPFEMQVAFAEEKFGNPATDQLDGVFQWPSLVRLGAEAIDLTSIFESPESQATMSSPKRYLWDTQSVRTPWIKVDRDGRMGFHQQIEIRKNALFGIAEYLTSDGKVLTDRNRMTLMGATESRYSRSSVMTFAIYEILLQVLSQINNPEFRKNMGQSNCRRVLKEIILTCPTALTTQEQNILQNAAREAVYLLGKTHTLLQHRYPIQVIPASSFKRDESEQNIPWRYDEATCSQLTYVYSELAQKFRGKYALFFQAHGKIRDMESSPSVNIASIDIGGGTTDFMICKYSQDLNSPIPSITPEPLFWEGFNVAGDDMVRRVIESCFLPELFKHIEGQGGRRIGTALGKLFGSNLGGQTASERVYRRQFANQVAAPFAYEVLRLMGENPSQHFELSLNEVFQKYPKPENGILEYINSTIRTETGLENFSLTEISIPVNLTAIANGVQDILGDILEQLGYLIGFFDCDIVLLSGRPSKLQVIADLLSAGLNFSPGKIVGMGEFRFGNWHPFAGPSGFVGDPKSTVCVGALIAFLNSQKLLPGMYFNLDKLNEITSTAKCMGVWNAFNSRISDDNLIFTSEQNEGFFLFHGQPVNIGIRQLESEEWTASPIYLFDYKDHSARVKLDKESVKLPFKIMLQRENNLSEEIRPTDIEIVDANNQSIDYKYFQFNLCTSPSGNLHWRESGSFITRMDSGSN